MTDEDNWSGYPDSLQDADTKAYSARLADYVDNIPETPEEATKRFKERLTATRKRTGWSSANVTLERNRLAYGNAMELLERILRHKAGHSPIADFNEHQLSYAFVIEIMQILDGTKDDEVIQP